MTYAFTQDVPINAEFYQQIVDKLGDEPAKGLITHLAIERPEGGLRYVDVWESADDFDNFVETRLHPVVHELLHGIFGDDLPPEPERTMISVIHCWQP